jgi:hypothetical protein
MDRSNWYETELSTCARDGWEALMQTGYTLEPVYLWFRRGGLRIAAEKPGDEWQLGCAERVPMSLCREQLYPWLAARCGRLECLPMVDGGAA